MKLSIEYESQTIEFTVEYRKRKTLGIKIEPPASIKVAVPIGAMREDIIRVVRGKGQWISNKLIEIKEMESRRKEKRYIDGELFMYLGKEYPLRLIYNNIKRSEVKLFQDKLQVLANTDDEEHIKLAIVEWYRDITLKTALERIKYFFSDIEVKPTSVKISNPQKRWGSCNSKKMLMFNWRCGMLPLPVFDYIVVHEMCHMVHLNHSKNFWGLVEKIMPDYKERKQWLRDNGVLMDL